MEFCCAIGKSCIQSSCQGTFPIFKARCDFCYNNIALKKESITLFNIFFTSYPTEIKTAILSNSLHRYKIHLFGCL